MVKGQIPPAFPCSEQQAAFMLHVTRGKLTPFSVIVNSLPWGAAILSSPVLFHRAEQEVACLLETSFRMNVPVLCFYLCATPLHNEAFLNLTYPRLFLNCEH